MQIATSCQNWNKLFYYYYFVYSKNTQQESLHFTVLARTRVLIIFYLSWMYQETRWTGICLTSKVCTLFSIIHVVLQRVPISQKLEILRNLDTPNSSNYANGKLLVLGIFSLCCIVAQLYCAILIARNFCLAFFRWMAPSSS